MNKEYMTWEQFDEACYKLAEKLKSLKFKNIYGVPRGGLTVAVRLSHLLNLPLITDIENSVYNTLVVDDISDTGETLKSYKNEKLFLCIATLYYHKQSLVIPNYYIHEKEDRWIVFPWEVKYEKITRVIFHLLKNMDVTPQKISRGDCDRFADSVADKIKGATVRCTSLDEEFKGYKWVGHCWVEYKGKSYDAETPFGVNNFLQLPLFKRNKIKKNPKPKYCFDCDDKREILTGSQIFYLCKETGQYRSPNDQCNLPKKLVVNK